MLEYWKTKKNDNSLIPICPKIICKEEIIRAKGRKINNSFINSGLSMIDDFLLSTPQGHNLLKQIDLDIRTKPDYYFEWKLLQQK